ncbi:MAG: hypothetical protein ABI168_06495, partial [Ginsengibacter sp.]
MNNRIILVASGVVLLLALFIFGKTSENKPPMPMPSESAIPQLNIKKLIADEKNKLNPQQQLYITSLENGVTRGDVKNQSVAQLDNLANFWKDSVPSFAP